MTTLNTAERHRLAAEGLALPDGSYPIDTPERARAALSYSKRFATPRERAQICEMVNREYPDIHTASCPTHSKAKMPSHIRRKEKLA